MIGEEVSYGLALVTGLLMGAHCIGMCGGFVVAYATREGASYRSHLWYAVGKLVSYSAIGAGFGALGSLVSFSPQVRGAIGIAAGLFLVVYGLGTVGALPLGRLARPAAAVASRIGGRGPRGGRHPLIIGLASGLLIACGPLHAMYVLAAGLGNPVQGGILLFLFGLGTLPSLVGLATLTGLVSRRLTMRALRYSGLIVVVMGMLMINRGVALASGGDEAGHCHDMNMPHPAAEEPAPHDSLP